MISNREMDMKNLTPTPPAPDMVENNPQNFKKIEILAPQNLIYQPLGLPLEDSNGLQLTKNKRMPTLTFGR